MVMKRTTKFTIAPVSISIFKFSLWQPNTYRGQSKMREETFSGEFSHEGNFCLKDHYCTRIKSKQKLVKHLLKIYRSSDWSVWEDSVLYFPFHKV